MRFEFASPPRIVFGAGTLNEAGPIVRSLGARAVRAAINRCEDQADKGLEPDRVSRLVSRGLDFSMPRLPKRS